MKLQFLIVFILLIHFNSIAQEKEYIVTNNSDTIYGNVTRKVSLFNPKKISFKVKDEKGNKIIVKPKDIKVIRSIKGVDGDCFIVAIHDDWFLKKIVDGKISMYQLLDGVIIYVSKDNSDYKYTDIGLLFSEKKSHSQIRPLIKDNPVILKEFDTIVGSSKNIFRIIEKYNKSEKLN